jgi:hypothetical protein
MLLSNFMQHQRYEFNIGWPLDAMVH